MLKDIFFDGIGYIKASLRFDIPSRGTLAEGNAIYHGTRLGVYQLEFYVFLLSSYHLARSVVINIRSAEDRFCIARPEGREFLQFVVQFLADIFKVYLRIDVQDGFGKFGLTVILYIFLESLAKLFYSIPSQCEASSIGMSTEVNEHISATLDGRVDVESVNAACRSRGKLSIACEYYSRANVDFRKT